MSVAAGPVRLEFSDYVRFTEAHPDDAFELLDGVIFKLAPEGDQHALTRSGIHLFLAANIDLSRYTPWMELSFPAPGYPDGPRPDNFVSYGPWLIGGKFGKRPSSSDVAFVIEVSSTSRRKDTARAGLYARLRLPEYWLIDLEKACVVVHRAPEGDGDDARYRSIEPVGIDQTIESSVVDGLTVQTSFLLQLAQESK